MPSTPPRRVLIATPYYSPHVGGVERYVESLVHELHATGEWAPIIVTAGARGEHPYHGRYQGTAAYRLPRTTTISNTPIGARWPVLLSRIIARERPHLINAHAPVPGLADLAARAAGETPFVLTYHTGPMRKDSVVKDRLARAYQRYILPRTLARADAVITSSEYVRRTLPLPFPDAAVTVHPGVDLARFAPDTRERPAQPPSALFVGSLDTAAHYKNLPGLLHALRLLADDGIIVPLTVAGDGDARRRHEHLTADLGLTHQVTFTGTLTGDALTSAYQRASFVVLPTLFDSFGTVLAEAMATATPVVASATGGIPELVTNDVDGLLVSPGDERQLAGAVRALAGDAALRHRLGTAARRTVSTRLSWDRQAARTLSVFEEAIAAGHARVNHTNRGQPQRPQSFPLRR